MGRLNGSAAPAAGPPSRIRVVFHSAPRMHVPADRLAPFDARIAWLSKSGPLWWLSVEDAAGPDPRPTPARPAPALRLRTRDGQERTLVAGY
ncbi:DUF2332 family protein [Streptacidiphilus sp. N1-12]|uniref:DUF2332 family protein n=2 Tax=Streptacidiphilus alkalitolerans TaxID=3342712 RepID=A0ABV6V4U3_9ACTN